MQQLMNTDGKMTGSPLCTAVLDYSADLLSSLMGDCETFLVDMKMVKKGEFFTKNPHKDSPHMIATWIMDA